MNNSITQTRIDNDLDDENNIENYKNQVNFEHFVVPEDADFCQLQVSWEEADKFAEGEVTDDEMRALGIDVLDD